MTIVIECTTDALFRLFETRTIQSGMSREVPGGATIQVGEFPMQRRDLPTLEAALVPILLTIGKDVVVSVFAAWLYDKWTGQRVVIDRKVVEVTLEVITKVAIKANDEVGVEKKPDR